MQLRRLTCYIPRIVFWLAVVIVVSLNLPRYTVIWAELNFWTRHDRRCSCGLCAFRALIAVVIYCKTRHWISADNPKVVNPPSADEMVLTGVFYFFAIMVMICNYINFKICQETKLLCTNPGPRNVFYFFRLCVHSILVQL